MAVGFGRPRAWCTVRAWRIAFSPPALYQDLGLLQGAKNLPLSNPSRNFPLKPSLCLFSPRSLGFMGGVLSPPGLHHPRTALSVTSGRLSEPCYLAASGSDGRSSSPDVTYLKQNVLALKHSRLRQGKPGKLAEAGHDQGRLFQWCVRAIPGEGIAAYLKSFQPHSP